MTKEQAKHLAEVLNDYAEGKTIEVLLDGEWREVNLDEYSLLFMTYCTDNKYYIYNDNEVTISVIRNPKYRDLTGMDTYITFTTHKQYNINDTIYFKN